MEVMKVNEWILIKDKLPEKDVLVLLQAKTNDRLYVGYRTRYDRYKCITARGSEVSGLNPIAWMELPELYKKSK